MTVEQIYTGCLAEAAYYIESNGFISILQSRGYRNLVDVKGGFKAIKENGKLKISAYVCPTTML